MGSSLRYCNFSRKQLKFDRIKGNCYRGLDLSVLGRFQLSQLLERSFILRGNLMKANVVRKTFLIISVRNKHSVLFLKIGQ